MKITSEEQRVLHHINYGKYDAPNDLKLNSILKTQFILSDPPVESFELLQGELTKLDKVSNLKYYEFIVGQLSYLTSLKQQYNEAIDILVGNLSDFKSIKTIYLYCTYLVKLGDPEALLKTASVLNKSFVKYPDESKMLDRHYLVLLFDEMQKLCVDLQFEDIKKLFNNNYNLIISVVSYFQFKYRHSLLKELQLYILEVSSKLSKYNFPKANEIDNKIEDFIVTICQNNELYSILPLQTIKEIVIASFTKTFQNLRILKQYIVLLILEGIIEEIEPSFQVYMEYIEKSKLQHKDHYKDIFDIIGITTKVLNYITDTNKGSYVVFVEKASTKLTELLDIICDDLSLNYNEEGLACLENKIRLLPLLNELLSEGWYSLALSFKFFAIHRSTTIEELNNNLSRATNYMKNCINSDEKVNPQHYFQLALLFAKSNRLKYAIKLMKICCFHEKENFKYWNFLTLLYSTEENYKNAENLINNSILMLNAKVEDEIYISSLTLEQKYDILQLKMTQISLIELMNKDSTVALECLPELFQIVNLLLDVDTKVEENTLSRTTSSKSKKNNLLKKILSSNIQLKKSSNRLRPELVKKIEKKIEDRILQKVWLWTANLFLKASQYDEVENCLIEAENVYQINSETRSKFAMLLLSTGRLQLSLQEFESALQLNNLNIEAVLGLSKLILSTSGNKSIFTDNTDKEAAELRLRLLLHQFQHNYKYCQVTEVYWYLSMLYEVYQDLDEYQSCLWKCVELEENKPVRSFECLEGLYHNL